MSVDPTEPDEKQDRANPWAVAFGAGAELAALVLLGSVAGQWLDGKLGTGPWLLILGAMSGITAGLYQLIRSSSQRRRGPGGTRP